MARSIGARVAHRKGGSFYPVVNHLVKGVQQGGKTPLFSGDGADNRDAQTPGEDWKVDMNSLSSGLIHQVDTDDNVWGNLNGLQYQIQVTFQAGGITNYGDRIRCAKADKVAATSSSAEWAIRE